MPELLVVCRLVCVFHVIGVVVIGGVTGVLETKKYHPMMTMIAKMVNRNFFMGADNIN
jgi:hypothetical protein